MMDWNTLMYLLVCSWRGHKLVPGRFKGFERTAFMYCTRCYRLRSWNED